MKSILVLVLCLCQLGRCFAGDFQLHLNDFERNSIREIIVSMGEKNLARLLLDSRRLTKIGDSIDHVPPLQFIGYILTDGYMKDCLRKTTQSYFKWTSFMDGFGRRMGIEHANGTILPQLRDFAELVGGDLTTLESLTHRQDWDQFIKSLI